MYGLLIIFLQSVEAPMEPLDFLPGNHLQAESQSNNPLPAPPALDEECESMDSTNSDGEPAPPQPDSSQSFYPMIYPAYFSPFPVPFPLWPGYSTEPTKQDKHEVLKPTAVHSKSPINVDELVGMSKLSLGEPIGHSGPSSLTLKLVEGSSRQSAFHANPGSGSSGMNSGGSPIHAV
ncbi:PREDICTED: uncharacterized protein LOC103337892 [Prunus mume]|uniref:Uncharacterized protein LOC103337892 n=1 Tax=Prunus mume TaxID=102107 RepID=A0ABM0PGG3_PRUMU|nr:PREDICTED: uncharacterized protein LOC103337892 [Prunus mume]